MKSFAVLLMMAVMLGCALANHKYEYGIMIDAGSSGSRLFIYTWLHRTSNLVPNIETAPLNQTQWSFKVSPGLGTYNTKLDKIGEYLQPLIDFAKSSLNASLHATTPIYLKATGGLRALPDQDQINVMTYTRAYLATTPFAFNSSYASVINLDQEGSYGWIAVNYLTNSFGRPETTVGALDMGGATTEIAYIPTETALRHNTPQILAGTTYNVYTGGYAARGLDTALILTNTKAVWEQDTYWNLTIVNQPCYLSDYTETFKVTVGGAERTYTLVGSSNEAECTALVKRALLNTSVPCEAEPCRFNGIYQPALVNRQYYAYSGYYYTYAILFPDGRSVSLKDFRDGAQAFCSRNFTAAKTVYPREDAGRLKAYCFTGSYISSLLATYGFADETNIKFVLTIRNTEVSWAVGAMLHEANLLPFYPNPSVTTGHGSDDVTDAGVSIVPSWLAVFVLVLLAAWL